MTSLSGVTRNRGDPPAKIIQKPNSWRIENAQGFNSYWFKHVTSNNIIIIIIIHKIGWKGDTWATEETIRFRW